MGRVSLLVEAETSIAIGNISKLGEAIKLAMAKFDSKALAAWEQGAETEINKVRTTLQKLGEELQTFKNKLKADTSFGASKALATFKKNFEDSFQTLSNFKTYFKEGYTFGASAQIDTFKTKVAEAKEAIGALNAELSKQTTTGVNQAAQGKKDQISKLVGAAKKLNEQLEKKPVIGAIAEVINLEKALQGLSANVPNYLSPIAFSLNALKTQTMELSQVLNSVQQPTWVEPFKSKMQEVVKVLQDIATAYKSVKGELKQSVGESPIRREFKLSSSQAEQLLRTTTAFYSRIKKEFRETRQAATETSKAIREAMAAVQGGGTGAGGAGIAGNRLGFGEQLFSRMRSNLYSYMTMWFGVGGAIRLANGLLEDHNQRLEAGKKLNEARYNAIGDLTLKAGVDAPKYKAAAEELASRGKFKSHDEAYSYMSFAAMSNISVEDAKEVASLFETNIAKGADKEALLKAVAYIRGNGYEQYSIKQIMAMLLEANKGNPSALGPTANSIIRNLAINRALGISLEEQFSALSIGAEGQKDENIATMQRAYLNKIYQNGLAPRILGDLMRVEYYKDETTGKYKFKDEELQRQLEEDVRSGRSVLTVDQISAWSKAMGADVTTLIGRQFRAGMGAEFYSRIDKAKYESKLREMQKISAGDTSIVDNAVEQARNDLGASSERLKIAENNRKKLINNAAGTIQQNLETIRGTYLDKHPVSLNPLTWGDYLNTVQDGILSELDKFNQAAVYLKDILSDNKFTEDEKKDAEEAFINILRAYIYGVARERNIDISTPAGMREAVEATKGDFYNGASWDMINGTRNADVFEKYLENAGERNIKENNPNYGIKKDFKQMFGFMDAGKTAIEKLITGAEPKTERTVPYPDKAEEEKRRVEEQKKDEKAEAKAKWDAIPKATLSAPKNTFIADQLNVALTDTSSNLQSIKEVALGSAISNKKTGGNILGEAFYAYASDKTNAATDEKIVEQLVGSLSQQGFSTLGIGKLVKAYGEDMLNSTESEDNKQIVKRFFEDVKSLLVSINDGVKPIPIVNQPVDRGTKSVSSKGR